MKHVVLAGVALTCLLAAAVFIWPTPYAYYHVADTLVRVQRWSGRPEILRNDGWHRMVAAPPLSGDRPDSPNCDDVKPNPHGSSTIDPRCLSRSPSSH